RGVHIEMALSELQKWAGSHFDPVVVSAAVALYGPGGPGLALHGVLATATVDETAEASAPLNAAPDLNLMMHPEPVSAPRELPIRRAMVLEQERGVEAHD